MHAVLFDLDNTLVDRDAAFRALMSDWLAGADVAEALRLDASGYAPRGPLCAWLGPRLGWAPEAVAEAIVAQIGARVPPAPESARLLCELADRGLAVALVSNGSGANQRRKLRAAGLEGLVAPERVLISGELGVAKPDARIFGLALERCGHVAPQHALFVGDHPEHDIDAALAAGLHACWLRRERPLPERWRDRELSAIETLEEVAALV